MSHQEQPQSIQKHELNELISLLNYIFRADGGDMGKDYPRHLGENNLENIRVIKQEGQIVAHVAASIRPVSLAGIQTKVAGIGAVATHPEARGYGFASILMQDAIQRCTEQGADIMLISGDLGIYRRLHAEECGQFPVFEISEEDLRPQSGFSLIPVDSTHIDIINLLLEQKTTRYMLPQEDLEALEQCRHVMDRSSDWWIILYGDTPTGFGVVHADEQKVDLLEWAGHPNALQYAAYQWLHHYGAPSLHYITHEAHQIPLHWQACITDWRAFEGTVLMLHTYRFMRQAQDLLSQRLGEETLNALKFDCGMQQMAISLGEEILELKNGGEVVQFLFGHPMRNILEEKLPGTSALKSILQKGFPLPLVWYGLGYV